MSAMSDFEVIRAKMEAEGVSEAAIRAFALSYARLARAESGEIADGELAELEPPQRLEAGGEFDPDLLGKTVVIKLNGGLGTSMGLEKAKSLLEVREGKTFLDITVQQILHLRRTTGAQVRFLLMNSFSTSADTLVHLAQYASDQLAEASEVEMLQNKVPKIDRETMLPVSWPSAPQLEWCPPGHGDLYPALVGSGWLDRLLEEGVRYAFVSNSDNLGAELDANLLAHFANSGAPFMMEVTARTEADKKGGHLARRASDGRLILREVAQCPQEDLENFQDINKHSFFNTNNLWIRLDALKEALEEGDGVLPLPMIRNEKNVDPRDGETTPVYQLETAMGAAIECFEGAIAVDVPRSRFAPVKTTGDLFALRSDAYALSENGRVSLQTPDGKPPVIKLSSEYKLVDSLDRLGAQPSLRLVRELTLDGAVEMEAGVSFKGRVEVHNDSQDPLVLDRAYEDEIVRAVHHA